jgi:hypothetical protein
MEAFRKCRIRAPGILRGKDDWDRFACRRLGVAAVLLFPFLAAGCSFWHHSPLPSPAVINAEVKSRVLVPPDLNVTPAETVAKPDTPGPQLDDPSPESHPEPESVVYSLPDAIAYALRNNPRLLAARAAIERARDHAHRGKEVVSRGAAKTAKTAGGKIVCEIAVPTS